MIAELHRSPFSRLHFWTEVFQEGMVGLLADRDHFAGVSAAALSLADAAPERLARLLRESRGDLVLRPMWMSNNPEIVSRLHVVAMNTPLEVDIYGHVNSTHVEGSRIVNGLGGSGDFFRNAYISVVHTPSRNLTELHYYEILMVWKMTGGTRQLFLAMKYLRFFLGVRLLRCRPPMIFALLTLGMRLGSGRSRLNSCTLRERSPNI